MHECLAIDPNVYPSDTYVVVFMSRTAHSQSHRSICLWQDVHKSVDEAKIRILTKALRHHGRSLKLQVEPSSPPAKREASLDLNWVFEAMKGGTERSTSGQIMAAIAGLNDLLKRRKFDELSLILGMVSAQRLSPELMLAFARVTFPVRELIANWFPFVRKVKNELDSRGSDAKALLKGLL